MLLEGKNIIRYYRRRLSSHIIERFLESLELNPSPEHFHLAGEYKRRLDKRELFNEAKRYASIIHSYISSLPQKDLIQQFTKKLIASGVDRYISQFFGLRGNFSQNGGKITHVEYHGRLILYRIPRNLRIPHFVYRFTVKFPQEPPKVIYLKMYYKLNFESLYIELANSLGLASNQVRYFPRDERSVWVIQEEIPRAIQLYDVQKKNLQKIEERLIMGLASHAALGDALRKYDRSFSNFLLNIEKNPKGHLLYAIDNELLLGTKINCQIAYRKGKYELFFLPKFPEFSSLKGKIRLISLFMKWYIKKWNEIVRNKERLKETISSYHPKIKRRALKIFNEELKVNPYQRLERILPILLNWDLKERFIKEWELLLKKKKEEILKDKLTRGYLKQKDKKVKIALRILFNPYYPSKVKVIELSIDDKILFKAQEIISKMLGKYNPKALSALEKLYLKKRFETLKVLSSPNAIILKFLCLN